MDDRVTLRPVLEEDLDILTGLTYDPVNAGPYEWFGWGDPHLFRNRWAENGLIGSAGGTLMVCSERETVGFVNWRQVPVTAISHCWEIGIILNPRARGQGLGTQAQRLLVRYLFAHSLVNRIQAGTEITNIAEQRSLEKAGFTREGVLRGCGFRDGQWRDGVLYSILRDEASPAGEV